MRVLGIFRRKTAAPEIDLEQLIYDIAEFQRDTDFQRLYSDMVKREVFLPVVPGTLPPSMPSGIRYVTGPDDQIPIRIATAPDKRPLVMVATQSTHPSLRQSYVGIQWVDVMQLSLKLENNFGILLQGKTSWVTFDEQRIRHVLTLYEG
jgi:hypothetical protein